MTLAIGERIRAERERYGMSQAKLAERIGLSKTSMNNLEQGRTADPHVSHIMLIADVLHISLDRLVGREVPTHADA